MTHPDVNTNIRAFKKLDFSVVFSYHLDNPTAKYADIILPQMHRAFEGRDALHPRGMRSPETYSVMETANHLNGNYFVFKEKCVDPPGEVQSAGMGLGADREETGHRRTLVRPSSGQCSR
jgi:anaerobic selenocysteine-containing dehydrogenase